MWHKIQDAAIVRSVAALPESERLPDGSWVTGFRGADPEVIAAAGWVQSDGPPDRPDDGHAQTLVWNLNGAGAVTGGWVQGDPFETPASAADILAEAAALPSPVTPADLADILARAAAALDGGA